jgi:hypothetical protein
MKNRADLIEELRNFWAVNEFVFEAHLVRKGNGKFAFRDFRKLTDKSPINWPDGSPLSVGLPVGYELKENCNYVVTLFVPKDDVRKNFHSDYTVLLDTKKSPPTLVDTGPKAIVESIERDYRSVTGIAVNTLSGAVRRISYDINRKPETFIFELIQNADDYPLISTEINPNGSHDIFSLFLTKRNDVNVSFKISNGYLIFKHNGQPFNERNVKALCSVDAGDKSSDINKIGYKGIGFKSIFKHSDYVLIHSGGYTFRFDKKHHSNIGKDIFWQLIPIWTDSATLPHAIQEELSDNQGVVIVIKPEEGQNQLKTYEETFEGVFKDERILLFLRHVRSFYFKGIRSQLSIDDFSEKWIISELDEIRVPDDLRSRMNIAMKSDFRIPQKYENIEKTKLVFATKKNNGRIVATEFAHIYAYLPTDLDFGFPFLLNGDFIPDGGRHYLHADLEWNRFLFKEAGKNLLRWISSLWRNTGDFGAYDMLPDEGRLVSERRGDEKDILLQCFSEGLLVERETLKFIVTENGELFRANEIILDDTGLFSNGFLPASLFNVISNLSEKLPHPSISRTRLVSSYLNIKRFTPNQMVNLLCNQPNKIILKEQAASLSGDIYIEFLTWFNDFCYENKVVNHWLLSIPVIRTQKGVLSFNEVLTNRQFLLRTEKVKDIEHILLQIGFELSEIDVDSENYAYLFGVLKQQESYLTSDLKLYDLLSTSDLGLLNPADKNDLIMFIRALKDVGPVKYLQTLKLFKSNGIDGALRPLSCLISKQSVGLPQWLDDFVIDPHEELALDPSLQVKLLRNENLFEQLFCNSAIFNEITARIDLENIEDFYNYILKLYDVLPNKNEIDYSVIPWVYLDTNETFVQASMVYWPDSFLKITDMENYYSIRSVIETISDEKLPHFSALAIKSQLALSGKEFEFSSLNPKQNTFDSTAINDFLDWAEIQGEKELLRCMSFSKVGDRFTIEKMDDVSFYHSTNHALIQFIESSILKARLILFDSDLYSKQRSKIGLLEGLDLLSYLIDEDIATIDMSRFLRDVADSTLSSKYLSRLKEFNIDSSQRYSVNHDEFSVLKLAENCFGGNQEQVEAFSGKLLLNGQRLVDMAISSDIKLYDTNGVLKYPLRHVKLSDIIPSFEGDTYSVSDIVNVFEDFKNYQFLKQVFNAKPKSAKSIYRELKVREKTTLNAAQIFFLSIFQSLNLDEDLVLTKECFFINDSLDSRIDEKKLHQFLDLCFVEGFNGFLSQKIIPFVSPELLIANKEFAIESELLPIWLTTWIELHDFDKREDIINWLGINGENSPILLFRRAVLESRIELIEQNRVLINRSELLINSLTWLDNMQRAGRLILTKEILKPVFEKFSLEKTPKDKLKFPALLGYGLNEYSLEKTTDNEELHLLHDGWDSYKSEVFSVLSKDKKITDDILPRYYLSLWKVSELFVRKEPDTAELRRNSRPFDEEYYLKWDLKDSYRIQIYLGSQLPQVIRYGTTVIKRFSEGYSTFADKVFYVAESVQDNVLNVLDVTPGFRAGISLRANKQKFSELRDKENFEVSFSDGELESLKRLFGDDIPKSFHKDLNIASLVTGLIHMNSLGYDISEAEINLKESHAKSQLFPVLVDNQSYTVMGRSAKSGLLYMTVRAWNRLDDDLTWLFVTTGKGERDKFLFKSKQEVLNVCNSDFQVFRVRAESTQENMDAILKGEFDRGSIWLIFKMRDNEKYNSIFDGPIGKNEESPDYDNLLTSDDSPY